MALELVNGRSRRSRWVHAGLARQFTKFVVVGISNTAISFVSFVLLLRLGTIYWAAGPIAFLAGAVNGYP